jgi:uncharacterized protein (DUF362 family)
MMAIPSKNVYVAQMDTPHYGESIEHVLPELTNNTPITTALILLRRLFKDAGLDSAHYGSAEWNPLGDIIGNGLKILLKPNWVRDRNNLNNGSFECLVTHPSVIEAVLEYLIKTHPAQIIVGDAPIQGCDFEVLSRKCKLNDMKTRFEKMGYNISIRDFRMTKMLRSKYGEKKELCRDLNDYCLFDLGNTSWLAPITTKNTEFRVTQYNPDKLKENHCLGTHRYLIAREVVDADVVINLPKLKTHKKAGITGALKNMVGINGFKEYLPHHRKGSPLKGGDCYPKGGLLKNLAENCFDKANKGKTQHYRYFYFNIAAIANRLDAVFFKSGRNIEGSWYGNDTVWRMCLDLQRILHYGKIDGKIADTFQRKVITITDAIIAGDGEGPLTPNPVPLGVMTLGTNVAALEWVHSILMRFNPEKIQLLANAFAQNEWPLADFAPSDIQVHFNGEILSAVESVARFSRRFSPPTGWKGHCEKENG